MPQCPICNAAVWVGQQYCPTCINPLPHPEQEDYLCPQCGIRTATPQEICQSCKVALPQIAGTPSAAPARAWRLPLKIPGLFLGAGLIIVGLLLVIPIKKSPVPSQLMMMTSPSPAVSEQTPAAPPTPASGTASSAITVPVVQAIAVPAASETSSPPVVTTPASSPASSPPVVTIPTPSPASAIAAVTKPTSSPPRYFVNNHGLSIRQGPDTSALLIDTLNFKDEVELLDTSGSWGRVRDVRRNIVGWAYMRYLQPLAADGPREVSQHRPSDSKEPVSISAKAANDM